MPFLPTELRQQLGLPTSCPSWEDIQQAAAAQGLHFDPHTMALTPANTLEGKTFQQVKDSKKARAAAIKALQQL